MALQLSPAPRRIAKQPSNLPSAFHPFETIAAYLSSDLSLAQTVNLIAEPVEEAYESNNLAWPLLTSTWGAFNDIVEQIPYYHSAHIVMAELFIALRTRPTPPRPIEYHGDLWRDMPAWEPTSHPPWSSASMKLSAVTARQVDRDADTLGFMGGKEVLRQRYMNSNAFLARLVQLKDAPEYIEIFALAALRWGLENDLNPEGYDLDVPGAAMWMLYAGEHIFKSKREHIEPVEDVVGLLVSAHPRWDDEQCNGFCRERWDLWKSRLSEIAEMGNINAWTKELAKQAVDYTKQVEHS